MMNRQMNRALMIGAATILTFSLFAGVVNARNAPAVTIKPNLENVREYAAAISEYSYAVDGGVLFAGGPQGWVEVATPDEIIVGAVAIDAADPETLYIGAANTLAIYRSNDGGLNWLRVPLTSDYIGGVTDLAVDSTQRIVYVGTDTAGVFRLRDVGSSIVLTGHWLLDEPVLEVAADSNGHGLAFARTRSTLYRGENFGVTWSEVDNLGSAPTAVVIADGDQPIVYVGTTDRGVVESHDGLTWTSANDGLGYVPGSRLHVDALAIDPQQQDVLYVSTSYLYGSSELHHSPIGVAMTQDGAQTWSTLYTDHQTAVTGLMPVSGMTGAVYAVSNVSRTPQALGSAPVAPAEVAAAEVAELTDSAPSVTSIASWIIAGLAAMALVYAIVVDLRNRPLARRPLSPSPVRRNS